MAKVSDGRKGGQIVFLVLVFSVAIIAALLLGGRDLGRQQIIDGLLADGYDVMIDRSAEPGLGRYCVRIWERGIGWVEVER